MLPEFEQKGRVGVTQPLYRDPMQAVELRGLPLEASIPAARHRVGRAEPPVIVAEDICIGLRQLERHLGAGDLVRGEHR